MKAHDRDPAGIPLGAWLAGLGRPTRCGIHGTVIAGRRCVDCDRSGAVDEPHDEDRHDGGDRGDDEEVGGGEGDGVRRDDVHAPVMPAGHAPHTIASHGVVGAPIIDADHGGRVCRFALVEVLDVGHGVVLGRGYPVRKARRLADNVIRADRHPVLVSLTNVRSVTA